MASIDVIPLPTPISLYQGADFPIVILVTSAGAAVNTTGWIHRGSVRRSVSSLTVVATFTFANRNDLTGTVTARLTAAVTAALEAGPDVDDCRSQYVYEIEAIDASGAVLPPLLWGPLVVQAQVAP
jgi:hypothetical protein